MVRYEKAELLPSIKVAEDVEKRIKNTGVKGLDFNAAREAGVFQRISLLLCAMHSSIVAAYRIFGAADSLAMDVNCKRNDIAKAMNKFEAAYDNFIKFWSDMYAYGQAGIDMNRDTEVLFRNIMRWAQLPLEWNIGDKQRLDDNADAVIQVDCDTNGEEDNVVNFFKSEINEETEVINETWCVTKYDTTLCKQTVVEDDMDKASAIMVAKRLSANDEKNVYVASQVQDVEKKLMVITPFKAFKNNSRTGKSINFLK